MTIACILMCCFWTTEKSPYVTMHGILLDVYETEADQNI